MGKVIRSGEERRGAARSGEERSGEEQRDRLRKTGEMFGSRESFPYGKPRL